MTNTDNAAKKSKLHLSIAMIISFLLASILSIYPLTSNIAIFRPMWLVMVLVFWLIFQPALVGVILAFGIGLCIDLLTGSRLGQQALCAVAVAFFAKFVSGYIKQLSSGLVWLLASCCLIIYQISLIILHFFIQGIFAPQLFVAVVTSILLWPLLVAILIKYTH